MVVFVGVVEYGVSVEMLFVAMSAVALCTKITIVTEKRLSEDHSPYKSHIFPLYNGIGLTTHKLTEIPHLGTLYDVMRISKTATIYLMNAGQVKVNSLHF